MAARPAPRVLLLDEPRQGINAGAKAAIYELIFAAKEQGVGVLLCSSDTKEFVTLCDRVPMLRDGRVVSEIPHASWRGIQNRTFTAPTVAAIPRGTRRGAVRRRASTPMPSRHPSQFSQAWGAKLWRP